MNIEIIEFYPIERNKEKDILTGTLRVKLPDIGIHILGIYVSKRKDCWFFVMPGKRAIHHQTGELIRFIFLVFDDKDRQRELMDAVRKHGQAFIENRLADTKNPLIFSQNQELSKKATPGQRKPDNATAQKQRAFIGNSKPLDKEKVWVDPPQRKVFTKNSRHARV